MKGAVIYKIRKEVAFRKSADGLLTIVSPVTDKITTVNSSAAEVWDLIDGQSSVDEIVKGFIKLHKEDAGFPCTEEIIKDVSEILESFFERKLIEISGRS